MIGFTIGHPLDGDVTETVLDGVMALDSSVPLDERSDEEDEACVRNLDTALIKCGESCRDGKFSDDQSRDKCYLACSDGYIADSESGSKARDTDLEDSFGSGDPTSEPNQRKRGRKSKKGKKAGKQAEQTKCEKRIGNVKKVCTDSCGKSLKNSNQKSICETACQEYKKIEEDK